MTAAPQIETVRIARTDVADRRTSPRRLTGMITAGAAALALLLATTLPVRAGGRDDDLAKALIAALVIGVIVHEARKDDYVAPPAPAPEPVRKKKKKKHFVAPRIPAVCALEFEGEHRDVIVYPERCLIEEGVSHLPRECARKARIYGEWDRIYGERCLREAGFVLPDDRREY